MLEYTFAIEVDIIPNQENSAEGRATCARPGNLNLDIVPKRGKETQMAKTRAKKGATKAKKKGSKKKKATSLKKKPSLKKKDKVKTVP